MKTERKTVKTLTKARKAQMSNSPTKSLQCYIIIADQKKKKKFLSLLGDYDARGSVAKPKTILGITIDTEKEIVLSVVEKSVAVKIVEKIKEKAGVGTAAHGLCFFLPVEMSTLNIGEAESYN